MDRSLRVWVVVALGLAVLIGIIAGRSQPQSNAVAAPPAVPTAIPRPAPNHVDILPGGRFARVDPPVLRVRAGQKVTWVNMTGSDQNVTADNSQFGSDVLAPGQQYSWVAKAPGRYIYSSYLNPDVRGEIDVSP